MTTTPRPAAPSFKAKASTGGERSLSDYHGKYLVIYFYPRAFTPGCTIETKGFRDAYDEIRALGAELIGISDDPIETQCRFAQEHGASFPILADDGGAIARAFEVVLPIIGRIQRVTFVIDPEGRIAARFHHELRFTKHISDVIEFLKAQR